MVPRAVVGMAVAVVLAVRLVVLVVVRHEIVQREPIMRGDEIDAGPRLAAAPVEQIARRGDAGRQFGDRTLIALPIGPHSVAIAVVPLGPAWRKAADLIAAGAAIPRLGDQLDR